MMLTEIRKFNGLHFNPFPNTRQLLSLASAMVGNGPDEMATELMKLDQWFKISENNIKTLS